MDPVTIALVLVAMDAVAQAGKGYMQYQAAGARESAIDQEMKESRLQFQQKTIANYDQMQKIMEAQEAEISARGVSMDSPSFKAISADTYNIGSRQQRNLDLEQRVQQTNLRLEKENVKKTLYAQLFGDTSTLAKDAFDIYAKTPSKGK